MEPKILKEARQKAKAEIYQCIKKWFSEDEIKKDITTEFLGIGEKRGKLILFSKNAEDFIVAGVDFLKILFEEVQKILFKNSREKIKFRKLKSDGDIVKSGEKIAEIEGRMKVLFATERLNINLLSRLCGIATETAKLVSEAKKYGIEVCATRKTTPGLRFLEKYAVAVGGGNPYRFSLSSAIMIKDNHIIACGGIEKIREIITKNRKKSEKLRDVIIEVQKMIDLEEVLKIAKELKNISVMLDNFPRDSIGEAIKKIREFSHRENLKVLIEISGGIKPEKLPDIAELKPDRISAGYITSSPKIPDISADIIAL
ncbi:putative nicotinate-nucleotide pyrophosphorylase [carboxylating] [bacterium HR19]|nr:putative nicotinate-nucleotide pyrophosphorylase [carboxylating] [bacterium HR19]